MERHPGLERQICVICSNAGQLVSKFTLEDFPAYMGTSALHSSHDDICCDLVLASCENCGSLLLKSVLPLEVVYQDSHGSGAIGPTWLRHHQEFAAYLAEFCPQNIVEIGSGHNILSGEMFSRGYSGDWIAVEPNPQRELDARVTLVKEFFNEATPVTLDHATVVHSHFLEHLYSPLDFLRVIRSRMAAGALMIFSVPNMDAMLERKYLNILNFEHTYLCSEAALEYMLCNSGFEIIDRRKFLEDHSVFFAVQAVDRDSSVLPSRRVDLRSPATDDFFGYLSFVGDDLDSAISAWDGEVMIFGAHVFSQFALTLSETLRKRVSVVLDNDPAKEGLRLYGTDLLVNHPALICGRENLLICTSFTGVYRQEIEAQCRDLNPSVCFC